MSRAWLCITLLLSVPASPGLTATVEERLTAIEAAVEAGDALAGDRADSLAAELAGDDLETASHLSRLGTVYLELTATDRARSVFERALDIHDHLSREDPTTAAILHGLGRVYDDSGEERAEELYRRALAIRSRELGPGHEDTVESAAALARGLIFDGDLEAAEQLLSATFAAAESVHDSEAKPFIVLHERLGQLADSRSDYAEARIRYRRALDLNVQHEGASSRYGGVLWFRIARLDYIEGNNPDAYEGYSRALQILAESLGPEHPNVAIVLLDRAAVASDMQEFDASIDDLDRARAILETVLSPGHPNLGALYHRYGETEMRRGDLDAAEPWLLSALEIREETLGPDHPNVAATLSKMAQLHRRRGRPELAVPVLERRLAIEEKIHGVEHPWYAATLYSLSLNHTDLGEYELALDEALEAERIQRNQLRRATREMSERTGLMYAADRSEGAGLKVALALATRDLTQSQLRRVWDAQIDARAFVLDELAYRRRALGELSDSRVQTLWDELAAASSELTRAAAEGTEPSDTRLAEARARYEQAELALARVDELYSHPPRADRVSLADVEAALPSRAALVSYSRYESYFSYAFEYLALIRRPDGRIVCEDLGAAAEIDSLVAVWRREVRGDRLEADPKTAEDSYRRVGAALRERIWDPVARALGDAGLALIVPDGQLALVNLSALPRDRAGYLVEDEILLHVLGTERDAVDPGSESIDGGSLLAMGAPAFDARFDRLALADPAGEETAPDGARDVASFRGARSGCAEFLATRFAELPGSSSEVRAVSNHWPSGYVTILTGSDANEASFKAFAPRSRVVHLATHGFFLPADCTMHTEGTGGARGVGGMAPTSSAPPTTAPRDNLLSISGMALAGANMRDEAPLDAEDGIVTAEEVAALDLSAVEWAVLSACDTGVGDVHVADGVLGLRRAFRAAGARTSILSLWSVDDLATRDWMEDLYRARFGEARSTAEAVREASLAQLRERRASGRSTHPFYWGAFLATGDWR